MTGFTLGADPEIFIKKNGKAISAHGLVPGTKKEPFKTSRGAYQVDGMALEFNIDPSPSNDFEKFNTNIVRTIKDLKEAAGDVSFNIEPVQEFDPEYLEAQPDEAKELGCDPDYSAYTLQHNPKPDGTQTFRTGAGHLHFGWGSDIPVDNEDHIEICADFVKMLDCTIGLFMAFIDRDPRRRLLYGKAGAMRPKPYGVEYRTPSNVWIKNRNRRKIIHSLCNMAIQYKKNGYTCEDVLGPDYNQDYVVRIINEGEWSLAERHLNEILRYSECGMEWKAIKAEMTSA